METTEIFDKVRELGEMIQESAEMKIMKDAEIAQENDEAAQTAMQEYNLNRMNLARDMQSGKMSREEAVEKNNAAFEELCKKAPTVQAYIDAKKNFESMVNQINQILNYYITGMEPGGCTHDCSSCGGCH